jgi:hypothetical protein
MFQRLICLITLLLFINGCSSNQQASQRVHMRQETIRQTRINIRQEKFIKEASTLIDMLNKRYDQEISLITNQSLLASQRNTDLVKAALIKMDTFHMGFWEKWHPANDALYDYPLMRYVYWINQDIAQLNRLKVRLIKRSQSTLESDNLAHILTTIRDSIIGSTAYQQEKITKLKREHRLLEAEMVARALAEQNSSQTIMITDNILIENNER